jgi:hypothetical protein
MKVIPTTLLFIVLIYGSAGVCLSQDQPPKTDKPTEPAAPASSYPKTNPVNVTQQDQSNKPLIYFYRLKAFVGWALEPLILCDSKEIAKMDNGSYFAVSLEPGKHACNISNNKSGFEVDIKAGESRYAKVTLEAGVWKGHGVITLMQPEQAAYEIKNLKLLGASKIRDHDLVTIFEGAKQ